MTTRKTSDASATTGEAARLITTITVLDIRLPITGSRPATKVMAMMVLVSGR
jgi:hypothetical protein